MQMMRLTLFLIFLYNCRKSFASNICSIDSDCPDGKWCAWHSDGHNFCKDYAAQGEKCHAKTLPEDFGMCNPELHYCFEPISCIIADLGGSCVEKTKLYGLGDCCKSNEECESGICGEGNTKIGTTTTLCQDGVDVSADKTMESAGATNPHPFLMCSIFVTFLCFLS